VFRILNPTIMNFRQRIRTLLDDLRSSLWFRPALGALLALVLALLTALLDEATGTPRIPFFRIGTSGAQAVLAALAAATLTVVGLIFSILMVVLVLASQQFSPRVVGNVIRDRASQDVLSIFIGAFVYSLLMLALINEEREGLSSPVFSVTTAILLALVAIGAFIYFIDHITKVIRINYITAEINRQTVEQVRLQAGRLAQENALAEDDVDRAFRGDQGKSAPALEAGYIQSIDYGALVVLAQEHDLVLRVERKIGDFVAEGSRLLRVGRMAGWAEGPLPSGLIEDLWQAFDVGIERTLLDDPLFGARQLVDIALKAVSPAVNDPTTAVNCIDYLTNILIQAAHQPDGVIHHFDEAGHLRLICQPPTFEQLLDLAFEQLRLYTRTDTTLVLRLLDALTEIAQATNLPERHAALWRHAGMISRSVDPVITEPLERRQINDCLHTLTAHVHRPPEPLLLTSVANAEETDTAAPV
jgi:uncharacterized membrane protein